MKDNALSNQSKYSLSLRNVHFNFDKKKVISGVNMELLSKRIYVLVGENGSGKTTLIKLLCGILTPDQGSRKLNSGTNDLCYDDKTQPIGYCPQDAQIWPDLTCKEQLEYYCRLFNYSVKESRTKATNLMERVAFTKEQNKLGRDLSGGAKKLLSVLLSIVYDPNFLLLDEPTAGLDTKKRELLLQLLFELCPRNKMILFSTHHLEDISDEKKTILYLKNGSVIEK